MKVEKSEIFSNIAVVPEIDVSLPGACKKYNLPFAVFVKKDSQHDDFLTKRSPNEVSGRHKRKSVVPRLPSTHSYITVEEKELLVSSTTFASEVSIQEENTLIVTAVYDNMQHLVEIILNKIRDVPRSLIQIIRLLLPAYEFITKISLNNCVIDAYVVCELNKILSIGSSSLSSITELCFDGTKFPIKYLSDLLDNECAGLKNISLARCEINDEICKEIATRLHITKHTEKTLMVLNLLSNHITDEGAKHLGEALRTNRHLRYLNLADNRICDNGALHIFNSLMEFPIRNDEFKVKRRRHMEYLKAKRLVYLKIFNNIDASSTEEICQNGIPKTKKSSAISLRTKVVHHKKDTLNPKLSLYNSAIKAELTACDLMGPFTDPFSNSAVNRKDDHCYCLGNFVLCFLVLSYNRLTYSSLNKLVTVLEYQKANKKLNQHGLIKVVIEGNRLPVACNQYQIINELLRQAKSIFSYGHRKMSTTSTTSRRSRGVPLSSGRN